LVVYYSTFFIYALNVPKWDDFALIQTIKEVNSVESLIDKCLILFKQHNEHRIFLTRFIALLDYVIFGNLNFVHLMFFGSLGLIGIFVIFLKVLYRTIQNYFVALIIAILWFTLAFYENSFWGMASIQNFWVVTWALLIFYRLSFYSTNFLVVGLLALVAIYTSGNGLLLLPIVGLFFLIHLKFKNLTVWIIFSLSVIALYFGNYSAPPDNAHPNFQIIDFTKGVFVMSGSMVEGLPIISNFHPLLFIFGGLVFVSSIVLIVQLLIKQIIQKQALNNLEKFLLLSLIFSVLTILLVSFNRVGTYGVFSLNVSRYKIYSILLMSLLIIYFSDKFQLFHKIQWQGGILSFFLFWYFSTQHYFLKNVIDQRRFLTSFAFSFLNDSGNSSEVSSGKIYQKPRLFLDFAKSYRKNNHTNNHIVNLDKNQSLHVKKPNYENQNLRDEGLYLLLVNETHSYVFPFIQARRHSIRNLFNYTSFFDNSAELDLNLIESDILPGDYEMKLIDNDRMTDFQNSHLLVPKVFIKPIKKNW